jgi:uncharacterized protein YbjT (DUF2867 family)
VRPLDTEGVETRPIDFDRPETLAEALEGVRSVFLASSGILHERAILDTVRGSDLEHIVKLSAWRAADEAFDIGSWQRRFRGVLSRARAHADIVSSVAERRSGGAYPRSVADMRPQKR